MNKIVIIGISGVGKSTLARELSEKTGLKLYHMDSIIWGSHWAEEKEDAIKLKLLKIIESKQWIIEGWIDDYSKDILSKADLVIYLDYSGWIAALGGIKRWCNYRGNKRPEMPDGCMETFDFSYIQKMLLKKERPHIESIIKDSPFLNIRRIHSRQEMKRVFSDLVIKINESMG